MPKETKKKAEDSHIFRPEDNEVTTVDGEKMKIPRLTWKKEIDLLRIIQKTLDEVSADMSDDADPSVIAMVNRVLRVAPERISEFIAVVLNQPAEWCMDNLDSAEILGVIIPLLRSRLDLVMERIAPFIPEAKTALETQAASLTSVTDTSGSIR